MKIYFGHSKELDFKKKLYKPIRNSSLNSLYDIIFPHEIYEKSTDFVSRDVIRTCDLMIAEVSYKAIGLGIEIGWADLFKCPILCVYKKGIKISGSLIVVTDNFIEYDNSEDLIIKLENFLREKAILKASDEAKKDKNVSK